MISNDYEQVYARCINLDHKHKILFPMTGEQKSLIQQLDEMVWLNYIKSDYQISHRSHSRILFTCVCPEWSCRGGRKKKKKLWSGSSSIPSNHSACVFKQKDGEGYGFICRACNTKYSTVQDYLYQHDSLALEIYQIARFNANCAGYSWNTESPLFWQKLSSSEYEKRKQRYKDHYEAKKRLNKENYEKRKLEQGS